jgi:MinD superfamily P-loop ATPase
MIISIASGKGGTGKTTVATNLALSIRGAVQILDCDVEEPNAHIFMKPVIKRRKEATVLVPEVDESKCNLCGICQEVCEYNAIAVISKTDDRDGSVLIFPHLCHGCGACSILCPQRAIREVERTIGIIEIGDSGDVQFVHGKLNIGEIMSASLIRQVKSHINPSRTVIIDAPPGTSCPVIASVKESDFCILVTEPTPFGLNDLVLAVEVLNKIKIPFSIVINRSDIGDDKVDLYCQENNIPVLMRIPFDREIATLYSNGVPIVKGKREYVEKFQDMFDLIKRKVSN